MTRQGRKYHARLRTVLVKLLALRAELERAGQRWTAEHAGLETMLTELVQKTELILHGTDWDFDW